MQDRSNQIILIPAYKPAHDMLVFIDKLIRNCGFKVVVVNDGSGKEYEDVFASLPREVDLLVHEVNRGKGEALKTGFRYVYETYPSSVGVITADADGQHLPDDIIRAADMLVENPCDMILGARHFEGHVPLRSRFGNMMTRIVFALASHKKLTDVQTGLRAFPTQMLPDLLTIEGSRYEYEMNMLFWATKHKIGIHEVKIETVYIDGNASSHFNPIKDSIKIYASILKFTASSLFAFTIDYILFLTTNALLLKYGMADELAMAVSKVFARVVSAVVNYFVNKKFVFNKGNKAQSSAIKFYALAAFILTMNYLLDWLLSIVLPIPLFITEVIVQVGLFFVNYFLQKRLVFKAKK